MDLAHWIRQVLLVGCLFPSIEAVSQVTPASEPATRVVEALRSGATNAVPLLLEQLGKIDLPWNDKNQLFAAFDARKPFNQGAEPGLRRLLTNASLVIQGRAAGFLQGVIPLQVDTVDILRKHLKNGDKDLRQAAAMALGNATNSVSTVGPELLAELQRDERLVAQSAAFGLARLGDAAASCWPTIGAMYAHRQLEVRIRACWAMQHLVLPAEIAVPILQAGLMNPATELRFESLGALRAYSRKARPASAVVAGLLHDNNDAVRLEAIQTLRGIGAAPADVLPDLVESLERRPNSDGYLYVAGGLLNAYGKAALPALARLQACYTNRLRVELGKPGGLNAAAATEWEVALVKIQNSLPAKGTSPAAQPGAGPIAKGTNDRSEPAIEALERDAKAGSVEAQHQLGLALFMGQRVLRDRSAGIQWFSRAGKAGYVPALSMLGRIYASGKGGVRDYARSRDLLTEAAEKNDATAQLMLGSSHLFGTGAAQDPRLAAVRIRKAAMQDNPDGQMIMGIMHLNGLGVARDLDEAVVWFRRATHQGSMAAQYSLGQIYHTGAGGTRDQAEAIRWYLQAANQGQHEAEYYVAAAYLTGVAPGVGHTTDQSKLQALGLPWLKKSAEGGVGDAQNDLGQIELVNGRYRSALVWLTRALVLGHPRASHNLALMFEAGTGVPKDVIESYKWHSIAARFGHQDSKEKLKVMEATLARSQIEEGRQRAEMIQFEKMRLLLNPEDLARRLLFP